TVYAQQVLYAKEQLGADDSQVAILRAAGSFGVIVLSLVAGRLRKRLPFSRVALGALMLGGVMTIGMSLTTNYWVAVIFVALFSGLGIMFNINTNSLRQAIAPNHMLGRVMTIAGVLAWSANPLGAYVGGVAIEQTQNVGLVFAIMGILTIIIPALFAFGPLGRAEKYLPQNKAQEQSTSQVEQPADSEVTARDGAEQPREKVPAAS
ncbi:MAG: MFS transporter, partial [Chloroflexota bacterium]|nr:MFS transporter [Chloroflexota bacterium]